MKKQIFTLLTLLLCVCSGAWAESITVTWLPNNMTSKTMSGNASIDNILTVSDIALSSDVETAASLGTWDSKKWVTFLSKTVSTTAGPKNGINKDDYLTFTVTVKSGYTFTPTGITAYAVGSGTGNNGVGIFTETLSENISTGYAATNSSSASSAPQLTKSITSSALSAGSSYTFYIYFSQNNTSNGKGVGMRDVILTGTYEASDAPNSAPSFTTNLPTTDNANIGIEKTLSVDVSGKPTPTCQWYSCTDTEKTGATAIDGATTSTYTFTPATAGTYYYYVVATNSEGSATSNVVTLTVTAAPPANPTFTVYGNTVQIACETADATIYYELGNADVKSSATKSTYSGAFIPASSGTIYAYAEKSGLQSEVVSKAVTLSTVGDVVGGLVARVQPSSKSDATRAFNNITISSTADLGADGRGVYVNHFKSSGTITLTAANGQKIQSIKIIGTSNDASKVATITAGSGATVISTPAELMPRDVTVSGVQAMTEIVLTVNEPAVNNSISFTLGRESRFYVEVYGEGTIPVTPAKEYTTYVTPTTLDFTGLDLKAYVATAASNSEVTMVPVTTVPSGTPLILKKGSAASYDVPVAASATAPATNLLKASDGVSTIGGDGVYDYILSDGKFYHASAGVLPAGKCYLHLDSAPGARELSMNFGDDTTALTLVNNEKSTVNNEYFDLQGRKVAQPTKGLYIVNGKKVIVK